MITELKKAFSYENGDLFRKFSNNQTQVGGVVGVVDSSTYKRMVFKGKRYLVHRVIYAMYHGVFPKYVDHINRDRLDNRIENLRKVDAYESALNRDSRVRSLPRGVYHRINRYVAVINIKGKTKFLGSFLTIEDASEFFELAYLLTHPRHSEIKKQ